MNRSKYNPVEIVKTVYLRMPNPVKATGRAMGRCRCRIYKTWNYCFESMAHIKRAGARAKSETVALCGSCCSACWGMIYWACFILVLNDLAGRKASPARKRKEDNRVLSERESGNDLPAQDSL